MDQTAVYLNCAPNRTVHPKGENTVSSIVGGSSSICFTLAVTIAMDESKLLSLFLEALQVEVLKDPYLTYYLPVLLGVYSQEHGWITGRWLFGTRASQNCILLDIILAFACYWMILSVITVRILLDCWKKNIRIYKIRPHYAALLQPCDAGINR